MWEKTEITATTDATVTIPVVPKDITTEPIQEETEADRLAHAKSRGITIGMAICVAVVGLCACGAALGAFLTRILAL